MIQNIPDGTLLGTRLITIGIYQIQLDNEETVFISGLIIFLDDGEEDSEQVITILTDVYSDDVMECIMMTVESCGVLFERINSTVFIHDKEVNIIDEIDLNELTSEELNKTVH